MVNVKLNVTRNFIVNIDKKFIADTKYSRLLTYRAELNSK